jgi:hypothetical protein
MILHYIEWKFIVQCTLALFQTSWRVLKKVYGSMNFPRTVLNESLALFGFFMLKTFFILYFYKQMIYNVNLVQK